MSLPNWIDSRAPRRPWVARNRGRRATDRWMRLETVLGALVVAAWAWGAFEITLYCLRR